MDQENASFTEVEPRLATRQELERVHSPEYLDEVLTSHVSSQWSGKRPDLATLASTFVGGTLVALDALLNKKARTAIHFPGSKHHAQYDHSSGFCIFNDFAIAAIVQDSPSMLFVPTDSAHANFKDFLRFAQKNPGKLKIATSGYGTQDDITLKYFGSKGYQMTNVPFAKPAERYASPLGKHTDAIYEEPGDVGAFLKGGKMRPLVVFDDKRHPAFPDVPTSKELGFEISDLPNFRTIAVSAKTPPEVVERLSVAVNAALATPEWKAFCAETYTCASKSYTVSEAQAYLAGVQSKVADYLKTFK